MNVAGAANNGSGKVRLTVDTTANAATGQTWFFAGITGTTEANGANAVTVVDATHIDLPAVGFVNAYVSGGYGGIPAAIRDIDIELDVADGTGNQQPAAVLTYKFDSSGNADTAARGYSLENVEIGGKLKDYNYGINALDLFNNTGGFAGSAGIWAGDTVRNIILRDLVVNGTSSAVLINATNVSNYLVLENIHSDTGVPWTLTGAGANTRIINVDAPNITDRQAVTPSAAVARQYLTGIDANGAPIRAQPAIADLTGWGTGVLAALAINVGSAGAFVTLNGPLGSPSSAGTMPAFALGGAISGGGNQINNVVIGASTPLAGTFTTVTTSGGNAATSTSTGDVVVAGGIGVAGAVFSGGGLKTNLAPSVGWTVDASGMGNINVPASSSSPLFQAGSGLVVVSENSISGETAVFLCGGGAATMIAQSGTSWSATTAPAAGKYGFAYSGSGYKIYNGNTTTTGSFTVACIRSRAFN